MDDSDIVGLFLDRDEKAIEETDKKYRKYCRTVAYNILRDGHDADEAVNDTYLGAWNSIPPNVPEDLRTFLAKITRNICLKKLRGDNALKRGNGEIHLIYDEISEFTAAPKSVESDIETKELTEIINEFLYSLSDTKRNLFIRRYWYFDDMAKLSERFGFTESKVKSMLFRIRKKLCKKLEQEGYL